MARVILAVDCRRRPFFGNSEVVVFLCLGFLGIVVGDIELSSGFSELSSGLSSGMLSLEKANRLGVTSNEDHGLLGLLR